MAKIDDALLLAEESIKRFGFVVVGYRADRADAAIGVTTSFLWHEFRTPYNFTPIRIASEDEWHAQKQLFRELFRKAPAETSRQVPLVLVTD